MTHPVTERIGVRGLTTSYGGRPISRGLDLSIPEGGFTVIIGPNACGKSTLLRTIARVHRPDEGTILLDGRDIQAMGARELARESGLLPQTTVTPEKMRVRDLVARGRSPHQSIFRQWSTADAEAVDEAMCLTRVAEVADRYVDELSGGQRQRVWLALVLAQQAHTVLLDEPTTYLDLSHQIDILELCRALHTEQQRTVVAVLHDLNLAARYATHLIVMKDGAVVRAGPPTEVLTEDVLVDVFALPALVMPDPITSTPLVIPRMPARTPERESS